MLLAEDELLKKIEKINVNKRNSFFISTLLDILDNPVFAFIITYKRKIFLNNKIIIHNIFMN